MKDKQFTECASKKKIISIAAIATAFVIVAGVVIGAIGCFGSKKPADNPSLGGDDGSLMPPVFDRTWMPAGAEYKINDASSTAVSGFEMSTTKAEQTAEYINTNLPREIPYQTYDMGKDSGITAYPTYGSGDNKPQSAQERTNIELEAKMLNAYTQTRPGWYSTGLYDELDEEGYLLRNGEKVSDGVGGYRKLFKHSASVGMYYGDVSNDEPAISKKLTYKSRTLRDSNQITGIYAPAGEVIKIEMSQADLAATGGLMVYIGQVYNNGQLVQVEGSGEYAIKGSGYRMWYICNTYEVKKTTAFVGSFLGGPIYVRPMNNSVAHKFSVTISGGVRYQHYILGVTTPEEYALNAKSSAPYFDLEIYDNMIRFSGSNRDVKGKTFEDCTKSAILWEKIALTSTRVQDAGNDPNVPIVAIFDCYIAAGAAFANPGRNGIVCPTSWMAGALDYEGFINNGAWGMMHEYNHCWQSYGLPGGSEVVNNATTLVSYMLYTKISAQRKINQAFDVGWNRLTDPAWALRECLFLASQTDAQAPFGGISLYASLLYNIGAESYIAAANGGRENTANVYYEKLTNAAHQDFTWFFKDVLHYTIADGGDKFSIPQNTVAEIKAKNYPVFVPVSSVYAVARDINTDGKKKTINIAQPFQYVSTAADASYVLDFGNRNDFSSGSLKNTGLVIPDGFTVNIKDVTSPQFGAIERLDDNKLKFTPAQGQPYSGEFKVTLGIEKNDKAFAVDDVTFTVNLKQANFIDRTTYVYENAQAVPAYNALVNQAGKLDFGSPKDTKSMQNVNSTQNCNTDVWTVDTNYLDPTDISKQEKLPVNATVLQTLSGVVYFEDAGDYRISLRGRGKIALYLSFDGGESWSLAIDVNNGAATGTDWMGHKEFTIEKGGAAIYFKEVLLIANSRNFCGLGLSKKTANDEFNSPTFLDAYGNENLAKDANKPFTADYFFTRSYNYAYSTLKSINESELNEAKVVGEHNGNKGQYPATNLFDNNLNTVFLSGGVLNEQSGAWEFTVDLGKQITAHTLDICSWIFSGKNQVPNKLTLYLGNSADDLREVAGDDKVKINGTTATVSFEKQEFRFFKLSIRSSLSNHYAAIAGIAFKDGDYYDGGVQVAPNDKNVKYWGDKWKIQNELCSFGHIYEGEKGDFAEFTFWGERVGAFAFEGAGYGTADIYIDGKLAAENVSLNGDKNQSRIIFVSDKLENGVHTLSVVGKTGTFNIDSFVYWK